MNQEDGGAQGAGRGLPLDGVRVVEFVHMVMGPTCGLVLADLGADVIKVEPVDGDKTRRLTGAGAGFFLTFNRNKRSLAVDIKSPEGREIVDTLIATADVVTENFRPGAMRDLGLDYTSLSKQHPGLIYCSMKGFLDGPYAQRAALDEVVQMMGGLAYMTGPPGRPLRAGSSVNDIMGGMFGAIGILAALRDRDRTGRGTEVKSALFENNVLLVAQHMTQYAVTGTPADPMPQRLSAWGIYDVFDTCDGDKLFLGVVTNGQWSSFCKAFGRSDLHADPALDTNPKRVAGRERLIPEVQAIVRQHDKRDLMALCERIGLPFAPITRPEELYDDPHVNAGGAMVEVSNPANKATVGVPTLPLEIGGKRLGLRRDVPRIGQGALELLEELGVDAGQVERLTASGVINIE